MKIKRAVALSAAIMLIVVVFVWGVLENSYITYPRSPDPQTGRVVPHEIKGIVVYIDENQRDLLVWLKFIGLGSVAVAALVVAINRGDPFKSKN